MSLIEKIKSLIPLGYLFLVIMGVLKESVFFYQMGINILKYSTIMDILISPIADLTSNPIILLSFLIFLTFIALFLLFCYKYRSKTWVRKMVGLKENSDKMSDEEFRNKLTNVFLILISVGMLSFFLGLGIGGGHNISRKIKNNKLEYKQKITFNSGETEAIYLIDTNSAYYFYVTKGNSSIKIAPIGAVKNIEMAKIK